GEASPELIRPRVLRVLSLGRVEAGEEPVVECEGRVHEERRVGVELDVVLVVALVLERVTDDAEQVGDVRAGADRGVEVGYGGGAGEAGIDDDQPGVAVPL